MVLTYIEAGETIMNQMDNNIAHMSLHPLAARRLSDTTKTRPMMESITPRWCSGLPAMGAGKGLVPIG